MILETTLDHVEKAARGNDRLFCLTQELADNTEAAGVLQQYLTYAFHPGITFGVAAIPDPEKNGTKANRPTELFNLCNDLSVRNLSGNAAREAIQVYLADLNPSAQKWALRLFKRDLRIDLGLKDANKALKAAGLTTIPVFDVPLAKKYDEVKKYTGDWAIQPKYDGARVVAKLTPDGEVTLFSRTGKEWKGFKSIKAALKDFAAQLIEESWLAQPLYLDGEVITYVDGKVNFQVIQKMLMRDDDLEIGHLKFVVFDAAEENEWFDSKRTYRQRYAHADMLIGAGNDRISLVPSKTVTNPTHAQLEVFCGEYVAQDLEGSMARKLDETIELKRSKNLVKCKSFLDDEAEIIGMVEGTGKYVGMMGTLVCRYKNGKEFEIGTGFSDKDREYYFANPHIGEMAAFRYQNLTDGGVPRIPSFRGIRSKHDC